MASNKTPLKGYMDGIDISAWQDTIDITKVPCDFVIVKATEGTDYKNRYFAKHCDQAMKAGKLLGAFHYANGGDPHSEAEYFIAYSKKYVGKAILVLDWEGRIIRSLAEVTGHGAKSGVIMCTVRPVLSP